MARPEAGLLASGSSAAPSRGAVATPVAAIQMACDGCRPVTVAGPRRSFTGLPLATGRIWGWTLLAVYGPRPAGDGHFMHRLTLGKKEGRPRGRPSQ